MAIEVKELIIRLKVDEGVQPMVQGASFTNFDKKQLIDDCVNKVLEKIESRNER